MSGCRKLLGQSPTLEDLQEAHPETHSNLQKLLAMQEGVSDLGLVFQVQKLPALATSRSDSSLCTAAGELTPLTGLEFSLSLLQ